MFTQFDHLAILVRDTEEALKLYRDKMGMQVLFSEEMTSQNVRLTHLDMGGGQLQLLQPLTDDHPLQAQLAERGEHLHHFCFKVDSVEAVKEALPEHGLESRDAQLRDGPNGRKAIFVKPETTGGILVELTGEK